MVFLSGQIISLCFCVCDLWPLCQNGGEVANFNFLIGGHILYLACVWELTMFNLNCFVHFWNYFDLGTIEKLKGKFCHKRCQRRRLLRQGFLP